MRENLILYSEQVDQAPWVCSGGTVTANQAASPDGASTADKVHLDVAGYPSIYQPFTAQVGVPVTLSAWMRSVTGTFSLKLGIADNDWSLGDAGSVIVLDATWRRYQFTYTPNAAEQWYVIIGSAYLHWSLPATGDFYVWGVQLNQGIVADTYVKTTTAIVRVPIGDFNRILIDGVDYRDQVRARSLSLTRGVNGEVPTLGFTIKVAAGIPGIGTHTIEAGNTVVLKNAADVAVFTGYLSQLKPTRAGMAGGVAATVEWSCACQDQLLRQMESTQTGEETFTSQTDKTIIEYLLTKYLSTVTTHIDYAATTIPSLNLSNASLRQCLEQIAQLTQAVWYPGGDGSLYYHAKGDIFAPLGYSMDAAATSPLLDGFNYSQEFSNPCNKCTVVNMLTEEATEFSGSPPATGDDGDVYATDAVHPPNDDVTLVTNATSIGAENTQSAASPADDTFLPGDSGEVGRWAASTWPPATTTAISGAIAARKSRQGIDYSLSVGVIVFDTSALPDDAVITDASLTWTLEDSADGGEGGGMWIGWGPTVVDESAYTSDNYPDNTAISGALPLSSIGTSAMLTNLQLISKTGLTGLQIGIYLPITPVGINSVEISSPSLTVYYAVGGGTYKLKCAMLRFDTSTLGAGATITGATLKLKMAAAAVREDASAQLGVEYFDGTTNWALSTAAFTATPSNSASGYKDLDELPASGAWLNLPLTSPNANLSKTAYSGFRIHVKVTGTPTGENSALFSAQESAGDAVLEVTYIPGATISGTYSDPASIAIYGTFARVIVNAKVLTQAEAEAQAEGVVVPVAWPVAALQLCTEDAGLDAGQLLNVANADFGVDDDFLIRQVQTAFDGLGNPTYTVSAGDFRADLVQWLRTVALKASQQ
jgi:hypothetical protein